MKKFKQYLVSNKPMFDGFQRLYRFPNGYGASVIQHRYSNGLELAVISWYGDEWALNYHTPITNDTLGYLSEAEENEILERIYRLEKRNEMV